MTPGGPRGFGNGGHRCDVLPAPGGGSRLVCSCTLWKAPRRLTRAQAWADRDAWQVHAFTAPTVGGPQRLATEDRPVRPRSTDQKRIERDVQRARAARRAIENDPAI